MSFTYAQPGTLMHLDYLQRIQIKSESKYCCLEVTKHLRK